MPTFTYAGKKNTGEVVKGTIDATDSMQAASLLKAQKITATTITEGGGGLKMEIKLPWGGGVKVKEICIFTRQFAVMIDAGLPLVQCLDILGSQQENPEFKKVIMEVKGSVEGGTTFAEALRKHPKVFDELFVNLVAAGEVGGILDTILNRLSQFMEKAEELRGKVKSAMTYPVAVIIISAIIVAGLLLFVVPIFEDMFKSFGKALPMPTQMVVTMSRGLASYWYLILGAIGGSIYGLKALYKTSKGRYQMDKLFLKMPVIGDILRKTAVARFTRTLGTMLSSGVPILDALDIVSKTSGNVIIEEAILKAKSSISEGKTLADPLQATKVFPGMVTQMISVGEATGAMDSMLGKIADFYEEEVDVAVESLTSLIEPMLMAFLGVVVGGLVIALYLPIFGLAGAAGG
ncbi:MAG: type II secretion system F family protein [Deltaproteobacteria bacterium]|nr:type II secretion system F family protein [Deltaproteobacteria bacterium]